MSCLPLPALVSAGAAMTEPIWRDGPAERPSRSRYGKKHHRVYGRACKYPECTTIRLYRHQYCAEHATTIDYVMQSGPRGPTQLVRCPGCSTAFKFQRTMRTEGTLAWESFCPPCRDMSLIRRANITNHHVPGVLVTRWLMQGRGLRCDLCERILTPASKPSIDHDHKCCRGGYSCGRCIRGLICVACNITVGFMETMQSNGSVDRVLNYINRKPEFSE